MSYSFDEIVAYHPDNINVYKEIKKYLPKLIPFIVTRLTQFAYYSWTDALKELSGNLTNSENKQKVDDLVAAKQYLDAAEKLEFFRREINLASDIVGVFHGDKLEEYRNELSKQPIYLLPYLFRELVLTTNFDEVLETVYRESGQDFQRVFLPGHPGLLRQFLRQGNTRGLFKLHGTVTGDLIEYDKTVFTKTQYERHYGKDSPLPGELKECFENRMLLFLGCSLDSDRTMELLQEIIKSGYTYYAIASCEQSERDEKIR